MLIRWIGLSGDDFKRRKSLLDSYIRGTLHFLCETLYVASTSSVWIEILYGIYALVSIAIVLFMGNR